MLEGKTLTEYRNVAVVGISGNPERPSYLAEHGHNIIPVNPALSEVLGKTCYPDLSSIPEKVEVVDIFRRSEDVLPSVDQAVKAGAKAVWMQEGVVNEEAAARARDAGLLVVMDRCMLKEHVRLFDRALTANSAESPRGHSACTRSASRERAGTRRPLRRNSAFLTDCGRIILLGV